MKDELLSASALAGRLNLPVQTLYSWERRKLLTPYSAHPKLYSLAQARALHAPDGYLPLPAAAEALGVTTNKLRALARQSRIPPLSEVRARVTLIEASLVPRIAAWMAWQAAPKYWDDYDGGYDFRPATRSLASFEHDLARGAIPIRFAAPAALKGPTNG